MAYKKPFINLDNKTARQSRIKQVGVELEGLWKDPPTGVKVVDTITPGWDELGRDGSLKAMRDRFDINIYKHLGELPSPPKSEKDIGSWLESRYPDEVGPECGLHVHISVENPLVYMWLMDDEAYPATVVEYLKRWATKENLPKDDPIWDRLAGNCIYCQHVWAPAEQAKKLSKGYDKQEKGNRYTAIACHFLRDGLQTIECRLLSMPGIKAKDGSTDRAASIEQAKRAVAEFCSITNRYLVATAKKEKRATSTVIVDQPAYELTLNLNV